METLGGPRHGGGGRVVMIGLMLAVLAGGALVFLLARRPAAPPTGPAAAPAPSRPIPPVKATPLPGPREARPPGAPVEATPPVAAPVLRVESDVEGASVFLDRKYLGTTPLETSAFEPGSHRLNVSAEGYEMYGEHVELGAGPNKVMVRFKEVRLDERVAVAHRHGMGSCRGVLSATPAGLRFEAEKGDDSFELALDALEPLRVDYLDRNLRVRQKGGKTWNFTADTADALLVFRKRVEAARARL